MCIQRKLCWCETSSHWCCHTCGSCIATSYASLCFTLSSYKDSKRVSWFTFQWWHRGVTESESVVWAVHSCSCFETLRGEVSGFSLCQAHSPLTEVITCHPWNSGLPGNREKLENMQSYSILKSDSWLFTMKGTHYCLLSTSLCLFACSRTCRCLGRGAYMHPKSSFCVCKSQHPHAQVSLFPAGGYRGSAWQGHMCISSCPFGQSSL